MPGIVLDNAIPRNAHPLLLCQQSVILEMKLALRGPSEAEQTAVANVITMEDVKEVKVSVLPAGHEQLLPDEPHHARGIRQA